MPGVLSILVAVLAVVAAFYQLSLKPILITAGLWRQIQPLSNNNCITVPQLQACESNRTAWTPALSFLNAQSASFDDYVAIYDPASGRVTRLKFVNFNNNRGFSAHGMDVVHSSSNPEELFIYLVNHRAPLASHSAQAVGADSSVEVFKTIIGSDTLTHIRTVEDPVIHCPNDLVGYPDGQSFYFTNDHGAKVGLMREFDVFGRRTSSVGYCHAQTGCKYAIAKMHGNNGIARALNDTFYVGNSLMGGITVLERQSDDSLVITDAIHTDRPLDNISLDSRGALWAAGFPDVPTLFFKHFRNFSIPAPSSALRASINTGPSSFYGEKYKLDTVFEDDGNVASGTTSVVYDAERHRLFLHGLMAPHLSVCTV
ncbi:hypothetical protein H0H92_012126 [Tricholoma furcatifolium]|nr:hypothetical protein H0H92_012126 [Tricholoma furcatifolium]